VQGEREERGTDENDEREGGQQQHAPVEAVGGEAPGQAEQKGRQELRQAHHAEAKGLRVRA